MTLKTTRFMADAHLESPEDIAAFLEDAFSEGDPAYITHALGIAARAKGVTQIAKDSGLSRAAIYKALSDDGNPEFGTVLRVLKALGLELAPRVPEPA